MKRTAVLTTTVLAGAMLAAPVVSLPVFGGPVAPELRSLPLSSARAQSVVEDVTLPGPRQEVSEVLEETTAPFDLVAVTWDKDGADAAPQVEVRVKEDAGWSEWVVLEVLDEGPDPGTDEYASSRSGTSPLLTDGADGVEVRMVAAVGDSPVGATVELVEAGTSPGDTALEQTPLAPASAGAGRPAIISRASWGADESLRNGSPSYMDAVDVAVIHHTASTNSYTEATAASQVRAVYAYHTASLGWSDIGYNFLVDRYGRIYEGRAGGTERAVQGAHAGGFNARTVGISALGNYQEAGAPAALTESISQLVAWKLPLHGSDPRGTTTLTSAGGGTARYSAGTSVSVPNVIGHRDVGLTACPGINLYSQIGAIRERARVLAGAVPVGAGNHEAAVGGYEQVQVQGWALRVGDTSPKSLTVAVNGADRGTLVANQSRPDIKAAYPGNSGSHGFSGRVPSPPGLVEACPRIQDGGLRLALPCRPALVQGPSPVGALTAAVSEAGRVTVSGWTVDGDTTGAVDVHVYADGVGLGTGRTDRTSSAVAALLPGRLPGFSFSVPAWVSGTRNVCAYGINASGGGTNTLLGCRSVTLDSSPRGAFEKAVAVGGKIEVSGWVVDPDAPSTPVHVYVDGVGTSLSPTVVRTDVATAYPAFATYKHGWSASLDASVGTHQVCAYGINTGPGGNVLLGCRSVVVTSGSPFGSFEALSSAAGKISLSGWVIDPDAPVTDVHVYVDGVGTRLVTDAVRPDVAAAYPGFASYKHAWGTTMQASPGVHQVCAYGINTGRGSTTLLGCRPVTVLSGSPAGSFEAAAGSAGTISFSGWAVDPDTLRSDVHVYVDGVGTRVVTDAARPDVSRFYPGFSAYTAGWSGRVRAAGGVRRVCAFAINSGPGGNVLLGCKSVDVPTGSPFGSFEAAGSTTAGRVDVSGWLVDPDVPASQVHVYVDGVGTALTTSSVRPDVAGAYPAYASYAQGWSARLPAPAGVRQVCAYGINSGAGANVALGCRQVTVR